MPSLIGNKPNQVSTNGDLGKLAFMDVVDTVSHNPYYDTAISDVQPTLNLDFVNAKTLDSRITFARASNASFYDAKSSAKAEENLLLWSQDVTNAIWTKENTTATANTTTAPDGTTTASSVIASATTSVHRVKQVLLPISGVPYTYSVYVKPNGYSFVLLQIEAGGLNVFQTFNITTGTVGSSSGGSGTSTITSVGSGWYRCTVTTPNMASTAGGTVNCWTSATDTSSGTLGDGVSGMYIWGSQAEQRSSATAYTPTTTQAITNYIPTLQTAANNVARLDYDPITREPKGLLIEESRANLILGSNTLTNATNGTSVTGAAISPVGSGNKFVENTSNAIHYLGDPNSYIGVPATSDYTFSMYLKAGEITAVTIELYTGGYAITNSVTLNLSAGTITSGTATLTPVGNGWYRCSITTNRASGVPLGFYVFSKAKSTYTGNGYDGFYWAGVQIEAGAFPTSYIPTGVSAVTRAGERAEMTGANFSSWYNIAEGTLYIDNTSTMGRSGFYDTANANTNFTAIINNGLVSQISSISVNSVTQASIGIDVSGSTRKSALSYSANNINFACNGSLGVTDTSASLPVVNSLVIGTRGNSGDNFINGYVKKLSYYPKALPSAELQEMTA